MALPRKEKPVEHREQTNTIVWMARALEGLPAEKQIVTLALAYFSDCGADIWTARIGAASAVGHTTAEALDGLERALRERCKQAAGAAGFRTVPAKRGDEGSE